MESYMEDLAYYIKSIQKYSVNFLVMSNKLIFIPTEDIYFPLLYFAIKNIGLPGQK